MATAVTRVSSIQTKSASGDEESDEKEEWIEVDQFPIPPLQPAQRPLSIREALPPNPQEEALRLSEKKRKEFIQSFSLTTLLTPKQVKIDANTSIDSRRRLVRTDGSPKSLDAFIFLLQKLNMQKAPVHIDLIVSGGREACLEKKVKNCRILLHYLISRGVINNLVADNISFYIDFPTPYDDALEQRWEKVHNCFLTLVRSAPSLEKITQKSESERPTKHFLELHTMLLDTSKSLEKAEKKIEIIEFGFCSLTNLFSYYIPKAANHESKGYELARYVTFVGCCKENYETAHQVLSDRLAEKYRIKNKPKNPLMVKQRTALNMQTIFRNFDKVYFVNEMPESKEGVTFPNDERLHDVMQNAAIFLNTTREESDYVGTLLTLDNPQKTLNEIERYELLFNISPEKKPDPIYFPSPTGNFFLPAEGNKSINQKAYAGKMAQFYHELGKRR